MPLHDYHCGQCGAIKERFVSLSQLDAVQSCETCHTPMQKVFLKPATGFVSCEVHYTCPITDKPITSWKAHRENLAKHGCRVLEGGEKEHNMRRREAEERELERRIDATAEEFVEKLPGDRREQLGNEISAGVTAEFVRSTPRELP